MGLLDTLKKAVSPGDGGRNEVEDGVMNREALGAESLPRYFRVVERINDIEDAVEVMSDNDMAERFAELRASVIGGVALENVLEEVFALVREASFRVLGLRHYDVQLVGGMVLHDGCAAEMATGEGKTIVAALPSALNAMIGEGVFVVTVNDYLARRDAELIGQIHRFLGLSVGLIQVGMSSKERREAYNCDVTYVTNSELGFDYLRDNLALSSDDIVMTRSLGFCIVDEADSILIDEARTPLIISSRVPAVQGKYETAKQAAEALTQEVHYIVNDKEQSVLLTERGFEDLENALQVVDLFDPKNPWASFVTNALKAKEIFKVNVNYIVDSSDPTSPQIQIVDEFTGRVMKGRRWSDGLHQAVEAKEGITIDSEATTAASVSYQAFFKLFGKLAGMTGTAATEAQELSDVYGLSVVVVPTALPVGRKDYPDVVFKNTPGKLRAVMGEIARNVPNGRPVLIGTTSVEASEALSNLLTEVEVDHEVLNAKPESALRESEIIAQAGRKFSITIATNMAGRGTDILLGGNAEYFARALARRELVSRNEALLEALTNPNAPVLIDDDALPVDISDDSISALHSAARTIADNMPEDALKSLAVIDEYVGIAAEYGPIPEHMIGVEELRDAIVDIKDELAETVAAEREEVLALGGLHVIGTERAESRRVDNQLRGRAGRQGDPGASRFFVSLDDRMFRLFGGDKVKGMLESFRVGDDMPIENAAVVKALDSAQEKVEEYFRDIRDQLFTYDEVLSTQRAALYAERRRIVVSDTESTGSRFRDNCLDTAREILQGYVGRKDGSKDDFNALSNKLQQFFDGLPDSSASQLESATDLESHTADCIGKLLAMKEAELDASKPGVACEVTRYIWLTQIDNMWQSHMKSMDYLKEFVVLRSYANDDPLQAYQTEGFEMFTEMLANVRRNTVYSYFQYKRNPSAAS